MPPVEIPTEVVPVVTSGESQTKAAPVAVSSQSEVESTNNVVAAENIAITKTEDSTSPLLEKPVEKASTHVSATDRLVENTMKLTAEINAYDTDDSRKLLGQLQPNTVLYIVERSDGGDIRAMYSPRKGKERFVWLKNDDILKMNATSANP